MSIKPFDVVINTCCLGPGGKTTNADGQKRSGNRDWVLRSFILPFYDACPVIDEIVVAGEYEPGPQYTYVESPSEHFNTFDCLKQRQLGFEETNADVILFQHDDHILDFEIADSWRWDDSWDIAVPARYSRNRDRSAERVNNGEAEFNPRTGAYIGGHACFCSRQAIIDLPWVDLPKEYIWDVRHKEFADRRGLNTAYVDDLRVFDVEEGSKPWN